MTGVAMIGSGLRAFAISIAVAASGAVSLGCPDGGGSGNPGMGGSGGMGGAGPGLSGGGGGGGNGGSHASCDGDATCGGNIVGSWAITDHCNLAPTTTPPAFCPEAELTVSAFKETGTVTYRDDGTLSWAVRAMGTYGTTYAAACLEGLLTCAELDASVRQSVETDPTSTDGGCVGTARACTCTVTFDATASRSGSYTTSGSTLTQTLDGGGPGTASYCVRGSTLITSTPSSNGAPSAIVVFAKQ